MKRTSLLIIALVLASLLGVAWAASAPGPAKPATTPAKSSATPPGLAIAQTLSTVTGVAISPLLGASAVGAWKYLHTPAAERDQLPWYAQPWFWALGLLLVGAVFAKDALGTAMPVTLKKPFDVAEAVESKVSALVVGGAFIPLIAAIFGRQMSEALAPTLAQTGLAAIDLSPVLNLLSMPFAMVAFAFVWLASHAINVLILISPWGAVDAALKAARALLLSALTGISLINPWIGALLSLGLIGLAYCIAGWSFRLTVFGWVFAWDFVSRRRKRFQPGAESNWAFTARSEGQVPIRTYGRLAHVGERLEFRYRPWLFLSERTLALPDGDYFVGRGLFHPVLMRRSEGEAETVITFPPRYRTHEDALARVCGVRVEDVGLLRGFRVVWRWLGNVLGFGTQIAGTGQVPQAG